MEKSAMKVTLVQRAAALLITTTLAAVPALAQPGGTQANQDTSTTTMPQTSSGKAVPSGTAQKAMPQSSRSATARQPGETMQSLVERRIADLHSKLHVTKDQGQQWDQFAQVMR